MKVETGHVVTLTYDITDAEGEIIESSDLSGPVSFLVGKGAIIPGLDKRVIGMAKGEEKTFELPPEEAFGRPEDGPTKGFGGDDRIFGSGASDDLDGGEGNDLLAPCAWLQFR